MSGAFAPFYNQEIPTYETTFTESHLNINGVFICEHGLDGYPSGITIWNGDNEKIVPDNISHLNVSTSLIDLSSYTPLQGVYTVSVTL